MKRILLATAPFDGHFNPLTGVAKFFQQQGYDVRWYAAPSYEKKLEKLQIPYYPFQKALEINQENLNEMFPERAKIKGALSRIKFDIKNIFMLNMVPMFEDLKQIYEQEFKFDILFVDFAVLASQIVKEKLKVPVFVFGVVPLIESSEDTAPMSTGFLPPKTSLGKLKMKWMKAALNYLIFNESSMQLQNTLHDHGIIRDKETIFDAVVRRADLYIQSGVPGFEYKRSEVSPTVKYVGPLLPYKKLGNVAFKHQDKLQQYKKRILISQGTVDNKDPEKLMLPALEALRNTEYLLIVATGYKNTLELRVKYFGDNIIIEDFVDFDFIMPKVDLFITNGGFGSVTLSLNHGVPVLCAGLHEGKNEINARVEYTGAGINLRTERPSPEKIGKAVSKMLSTNSYKQNTLKLQNEFLQYNPYELIQKYLKDFTSGSETMRVEQEDPMMIS